MFGFISSCVSTLLADSFGFNLIRDVWTFSENKINFCQADGKAIHSDSAVIVLDNLLIFFIKGSERAPIDRLAHIKNFLGMSLFQVFNCLNVHLISLLRRYVKIISHG